MVICLQRGADLHMAQLMPLPLAVSCFSKIQIGFTFLVPAHPGSPGQRAVKRVCSMCINLYIARPTYHFILIYTCGLTAVIKRICSVTELFDVESTHLNKVRNCGRRRGTGALRTV